MEINGVIKTTVLTTTAFQIACELVYEEKQAVATFVMENTPENFAEIMKVSGQGCWEQLPNTPVKLRLVTEGDKVKLDAIGHFMVNYWLNVPQTESEETEAE